MPVYFSLTGKGFVLDDLKETIFIFLYDYDSVTDPDKVGSVGFKLSDYMFGKDAYKEQITKANGNTEISISVSRNTTMFAFTIKSLATRHWKLTCLQNSQLHSFVYYIFQSNSCVKL